MATVTRPSMVERLAVAFHGAGNYAAGRLVAAARQNDDKAARFWELEMARCDDQADILETLIREGRL